MAYFISLIALPLLCVFWIVFQQWLARQDPKYQGYQAGCGGCSRSCGEAKQEIKTQQNSAGVNKEKIHYIDASSLWPKE